MSQTLSCVFCKIVNGEIPAFKVYEDEQFLGFLDIRPEQPGHVQLIPKKHFRWVWDMPAESKSEPCLVDYIKVAKKIADAQRTTFGTEMIVSRIIGDEVPHAHFWLVPHKHTQNEKLKGEELASVIRGSF